MGWLEIVAGLLAGSFLGNAALAYKVYRLTRSSARRADAETDAAADTSAVGHWQEYATELHREIRRLNTRIDANDKRFGELIERERECQIHAARQDEKIKGLEVEVGALRAQIDAYARGTP